MEQFQPEQVRRIWQRVQNREHNQPENQTAERTVCRGTQELYAGEIADSTLLFRLSKYFSGQNAARLRKIAREDQSHAALIRGICTMTEGRVAAARQGIEKGRPVVLLQRCYGRKMQRISEYESRASDPQYGHAFQKMAEQEHAHCRILLSIIGSIRK